MVLKGVIILHCLAVANAGVIGPAYAPTPSIFTPIITKTISPEITKTVTPVSSKPVYEAILTTHESNHKSSDGSSFSKTLDTSFSESGNFEASPFSTYGVSSFHPVSSFGETSLLANKDLPVIKTISPNIVYPASSPILTNTVYHQDSTFGQITPINNRVFPVVPKTYSSLVTSPFLIKTITPVLKKNELVTPVLTAHVTPVLKTVSPVLTKANTPAVYNTRVVTKTYAEPTAERNISPVTTIQTAPAKISIPYSDAPIVSHMSFNGLGVSYAW